MTSENERIRHALEQLSTRSAVLEELVRSHGPYTPRRTETPDVFGSLAKTIIYQQLAGKAAATIHGRFVALLQNKVSPSAVLALSPEDLRSAGLSRAKAAAILDLASHAEEGRLDPEGLESLDDEALIKHLCKVRGVGPWTAQMFLLFQLGRLDVWPTGDLAVRKGFALAFGLPKAPSARELQPLGDRFRPYRSIVAWYCWRVLDTAVPKEP